MDPTIITSGSLFSRDYLTEGIKALPEWAEIDVDGPRSALREVFARFPADRGPNESQTETDSIWPVLDLLGWRHRLHQQNLAARGRDDVPDGIVFLSEDAKNEANAHPEEWKRYGFGAAIVEAKRWDRPLDRRSTRRREGIAPSTQMLANSA